MDRGAKQRVGILLEKGIGLLASVGVRNLTAQSLKTGDGVKKIDRPEAIETKGSKDVAVF